TATAPAMAAPRRWAGASTTKEQEFRRPRWGSAMDAFAADKAEAPTRRPISRDGAKAIVLFNEKAGSVSPGDGEKLVEAVKQAGIEHVAVVGPEKLSRKLLERA